MTKKGKNENTPDNIIPMIREKRTRSIIQDQFRQAQASDRVKNHLDSINQKMTDLREMIQKQNDYLNQTGSNLANPYAAGRMKEEPRYLDESTSSTTLPDQAALEAEYRRKQDEMRKKREQNNRDVTRTYRLNKKPSRDKD